MNTAPKLPDQLLAWNVRNALGPYNDDDMPLIDLIIQLRNKIAAIAPPSGEGMDGDMAEVIDLSNRAEELAERLVMAGPKASHVSASETHEISECLTTTPQSAPVDGETRPIYWMGEEVKTTARLIEIVKEQCSAAIDYVLADDTTPPPASQERGGEYLNFVLHRLHELEDDAQGEVDKYRQSDDADSRSCGYWTGKVSAFGEIAELLEASPPSSAAAPKEWSLEEIETKRRGYECEHNFVSMPHKPTFDYCTRCGTSRRALDAAEQAKPVAINPVEIDSKLIPDAAEQAKPERLESEAGGLESAEQARTGEFREWFRKLPRRGSS